MLTFPLLVTLSRTVSPLNPFTHKGPITKYSLILLYIVACKRHIFWCAIGVGTSRWTLEASVAPCSPYKRRRSVDLSMDTMLLKYTLVLLGSEGSNLTLPHFLLSATKIRLCHCFSTITKEHSLEICYGTIWLLCVDVPLNTHSSIHSSSSVAYNLVRDTEYPWYLRICGCVFIINSPSKCCLWCFHHADIDTIACLYSAWSGLSGLILHTHQICHVCDNNVWYIMPMK